MLSLHKLFKLSLLGALLLSGLSCAPEKARITPPDFDGARAFDYLERQVAFGPRVPGTLSSAACREYLVAFFRERGAAVDTFVFNHNDKSTGKIIPMVNVIARFKGAAASAGERYMIAAHYDSRPRAEYDADSTKRNNPIDGANDGASGVAVAMELANLFSRQKPRVDIDIFLLDGEDWGRPGDLDEYFLGAKAMLNQGIKGNYKFAILIDMVGDRDLKIYREEYSSRYAPELTDRVWHLAAELGETGFIDSVGYGVQDDHLSFMTIDLPAVVIIDFIYPYWHTAHDTPDKCSPQSLRAVGRVVSTLLYNL